MDQIGHVANDPAVFGVDFIHDENMARLYPENLACRDEIGSMSRQIIAAVRSG